MGRTWSKWPLLVAQPEENLRVGRRILDLPDVSVISNADGDPIGPSNAGGPLQDVAPVMLRKSLEVVHTRICWRHRKDDSRKPICRLCLAVEGFDGVGNSDAPCRVVGGTAETVVTGVSRRIQMQEGYDTIEGIREVLERKGHNDLPNGLI